MPSPPKKKENLTITIMSSYYIIACRSSTHLLGGVVEDKHNHVFN